MRWKPAILMASLSLFFVFLGVIASPNGLKELIHLKNQMSSTKDHTQRIEEANRDLRRRVELFRRADPSAKNFRFREQLGLIKEGELLYLESTR